MTLHVDIRCTVSALTLHVHLTVQGGPVVLVGPNGAGKTSLLRALVGGLRPEQGQIVLNDHALFHSGSGRVAAPEERRIGYVPQGQGLFPHLNALDNVAFGLSVGARRMSLEQRQRIGRAALHRLEAGSLAAQLPHQLSGGEKQRVALARALVVQPQLLLLDEPLSALDARARRQVRALLAQELRDRLAIVVSHDLRDAAALGAPVYVMDRGRIIQSGSIAELRAKPVNDFVAELTSSPFGPGDAVEGGAPESRASRE